MPFQKLRPPRVRERARTVLASVEHPPSLRGGGGILHVRLGPDVWKEAGLTLGQKVDVRWGYGADAGSILVVPDDGGPGLRTQSRKRKSGEGMSPDQLLLETDFTGLPPDERLDADGAAWTWLPGAHQPEKCGWRVDEGGVVIVLPREWWRIATPAGVASATATIPADEVASPERPADPSPPEPIAAAPPVASRVPPARPPAPAEEDKLERAVALIASGLLDSEIIRSLRCTPHFLHDAKAERSKRLATAAASVANGEAHA